MPNFIWMCSLCRLAVAKKTQFWTTFDALGLLYRPPITDEGQILCAWADPRSTLTCQISSECVHCVGFQWPKTHNFGQILTFWGLLYRLPFTDDGQIWCAIADPRYTLTCQISPRSVYSVTLCWRKPRFFAVFWTSAFSVVADFNLLHPYLAPALWLLLWHSHNL